MSSAELKTGFNRPRRINGELLPANSWEAPPIETFADPDNFEQDVARYMAQWQNQTGYLVTYVDGARVDLPLSRNHQPHRLPAIR